MPVIHILPKNIADLIAAGEVVERPSSVVKELLENSIDAGSKNVTVEIMNGGISFIRVTDDGCGIRKEDIRNAFLPHATSKIQSEADLDRIFTLGFRGEALASVCAVSKTDVLTKTQDSETGVHYIIEGGSEIEYSEAGCPDGTTIVVSDIFYNTPARMKFLKKDVTEANYIAEIVDRTALSHPEISFRFIRDGKQVLVTSGNGELKSTAYSVLGNQFTAALIPVDYEYEGVKVGGYISKPSNCRNSRSMQFFFLNGRYIKSKTIIAAIENAYKNSVMVGKFPSCALNITIDPAFVDVNVHPTKTEVRFSDEKKIFNSVYYACSNSISQNDTRVKMDISKPVQRAFSDNQERFTQMKMEQKKAADFWQRLDSETFSRQQEAEQRQPVTQKRNEFVLKDSSQKTPLQMLRESSPLLAEYDKRNNEDKSTEKTPLSEKNETELLILDEEIKEEKPIVLGEAFKTYIIVQNGEKLLLIDKHASHERMIYNSFKNKKIPTQYLLTPVTVSLSKTEYSLVLENAELFSTAGYCVEDFGSGTVIVRECPSVIGSDDIEGQIVEIASHLNEYSSDTTTEKIDWIFHSAACRGAIKAGDKTTLAELQLFVEELLKDDSIRYCPHGRPILIEITKNEIEKQFGRTV